MEVKELKNVKAIKKTNDNRNTIHSGMEPFVNMTLDEELTTDRLKEMILAHMLTRGYEGQEVETTWTIESEKEDIYPIRIMVRDYPSLYKKCHDLRIATQVKHEKGWVRVPNGTMEIVNDLLGGTANTISQLSVGCERLVSAINIARSTDEDADAIRNLQEMLRNKLVTIFTKFCALRQTKDMLRHHAEQFTLGEEDKESFAAIIDYTDDPMQYTIALVSEKYGLKTEAVINATMSGYADTKKAKIADICYEFAHSFVKKAKEMEE